MDDSGPADSPDAASPEERVGGEDVDCADLGEQRAGAGRAFTANVILALALTEC
ncbi:MULTISPECIES: hypothetical protein [unclassified Arthrobacter]|uniref:hypothetical protein n=1 Tax=unclassified Arthrobacter TaxID=235627 RepID=UPI002E155D4B|nr:MULTISPECIES: hypothetical protein [unclassified Arthrobacter]